MARQHQRNLAHFSSPDHRQYLRNAGHFEFGHERIPITIDAEKTRHIQTLWGEGRDAEGWAEYWNAIYAWTYEEVLQHETLKTRCLVVPFEQLCAAAEQKITDILAFCNLDADEAWVPGLGRGKSRISPNTKRRLAPTNATSSCRYAARRRRIMGYSYSHPKPI